MQKYQNHKERMGENLSLKPIGIGFALILIVISIFFSKNFLFKKEKQEKTIPEEKNQQVAEDLSVPMILPEDLQKIVHKSNNQLIDIRNKDEFEFSHIENSKNIPLDSLKGQVEKLDKNISLIIIDRVETKEGKEITQFLIKNGFSAKYLVGGIVNFSESGFPVISFGNPNSITDIAKASPLSTEEVLQKVTDELGSINFLDVRPKNKFDEYHIQGSVNIPLEEIEERKKDVPAGKIIIFDEDPVRSFQASVRLHDMNFTGIFCLKTSLSDFEKRIEEIKKNPPSSQENSAK